MFYAMVFQPTEFNSFVVRAARTKPFKTLEAAKRSVIKAGSGYVKTQGNRIPVWSNVK